MISSVIFTNVDSHKLGGENLIKMAYFDSLGRCPAIVPHDDAMEF